MSSTTATAKEIPISMSEIIKLVEDKTRMETELNIVNSRLQKANNDLINLKNVAIETKKNLTKRMTENMQLRAQIVKDGKINSSHMNAVYKEKNGQINELRSQLRAEKAAHKKCMLQCTEWESNYYDAQKEADETYMQQRVTYCTRLAELGDKYEQQIKLYYRNKNSRNKNDDDSCYYCNDVYQTDDDDDDNTWDNTCDNIINIIIKVLICIIILLLGGIIG